MLAFLTLSAVTLALGVSGQTPQTPAPPYCVSNTIEFDEFIDGGKQVNGVGRRRVEEKNFFKYDYNAKMVYSEMKTLDDATGNWTFSKIPMDLQRDNATFVRTGKFGYGAKSLTVNTFEFMYPSKDGSKMQVRFAVDTERCVPVVETVAGSDGGAHFSNTIFYGNVKLTIADRTAFSPPASCMQN